MINKEEDSMKTKKPKQRNHVAQYSWNKSGAGAHRDKTKYSRKGKNKGQQDLYFLVAA